MFFKLKDKDLRVTLTDLFFKWGFNPFKAEQPLWGMELQEKEVQKDKAYRKSVEKEPADKRCLLDLELKLFRS